MATEHVDQDKQPEQSEVSSSSGWNVTTRKMVIKFYKENRVLWDRNQKDYRNNSIQKKLFTPLVPKLERSNESKSELRTRSSFLLHLRCIRWSAMLNLKTSSNFPSFKFARVPRTSVLSQQQCRRGTCRRDLSHRVSRP